MSSVVYNSSATKAASAELFAGAAGKMYRYQHIMPAPLAEAAAAAAGGTTGSIKTRKYTPRGSALSAALAATAAASSGNNGGGAPYSVDQSQSVQRRNARERNRVKQVNNSFARLRQHIPQSIIADLTKGGGRGPHKKISKVDTLRIAVEYIRRLQDLVDDLNGGSSSSSSSSLPLTISQLCHDETSSNSSHSSHSSSSSVSSLSGSSFIAVASAASTAASQAGTLYYSSALATPLQQQQQLARQQFPHHPLTPISLNAYSPPQGNISALAITANSSSSLTASSTLDSAGCHSPTSSFNSSMSFDSGTYEAAPQQLSPPTALSETQTQAQSQSQHLDAHLQLKFEPYEHFNLDEEDCTPDDEEILDYISLWQEQ